MYCLFYWQIIEHKPVTGLQPIEIHFEIVVIKGRSQNMLLNYIYFLTTHVHMHMDVFWPLLHIILFAHIDFQLKLSCLKKRFVKENYYNLNFIVILFI